MLKKIIVSFLIFIVFTSVFTTTIFASTKDIDPQAKETIINFFRSINGHDKSVYNYLDEDNTELSNNIKEYLNTIKIKYEIKNITEENDGYKIDIKMEASGKNWKVSGITVNCELKKIGNEYKIVNTNLFDYVGTENVTKFALNIANNVFSTVGVIFLSIAVIIIIIVIIVVVTVVLCTRKKKENKNENSIIENNENNNDEDKDKEE